MRWGGLLLEGAGPAAELEPGCYWTPAVRPFDRWDKSAASGTRSAGSCGGTGKLLIHSGFMRGNVIFSYNAVCYYQTTRAVNNF